MPEVKQGAVFLFLMLALAFMISPACAKVITYNGTGNAAAIQDLINNASSGDSIFIGGGTYYGEVVIDRSIVFGALDMDDPPYIVSDSSKAGITLASDGITLNGVIVSGNASYGILVISDNNRITYTTVSGHEKGLVLKSASNNIITQNTFTGNAVGVEVDRSSRSNTFSLNTFTNTIDAVSQSSGTSWDSTPQGYWYQGSEFSGPLGNYWSGAGITDSNGDGVGDTPYTLTSAGQNSPGATVVTDTAPLVSLPSAYTISTKSEGQVFNSTRIDNLMQQRLDGQSSAFSQQPDTDRFSSGSSGSAPTVADAGVPQSAGINNPQAPLPNPVVGFLIQFWWLIPVGLFISAIAGILFERSRRRRIAGAVAPSDPVPAADMRSATIVKRPDDAIPSGSPDREYSVRLPAALEKKYPGAEYIAEGGVCRVFHARDIKNNRDVAVKVPIRFDEVTGSQFTKELNIWEGLHHKNIVEIYSANIFPRPYIEMEYVESSLDGMHFPLDKKRAASIITGVAEGLRYAHDQGIVHRDIKPGNILITPDGTPKITDWGLSKAQGTKQSGLIGFSLEYAAPEQLAPTLYGEPGPGTDIYQLGVLFFEMLTGQVPFHGEGMGEITHSILHDIPAPALSGTGTVAEAINSIIARCLEKKPQDRYASVAELLNDLRKIDWKE